MKLKYLLLTAFISILLVGCSTKNQSTEATKVPNKTSNSTELSNKINENSVIRAEGISKFGTIIVTPNGKEDIGQLGADSSYGKSTDYTFNADYNIIFKDSSNNKKIIGKIEQDNIPIIIQPKNTSIEMEKLIMNENELFVFIPQYSGANSVPLYVFSVDKNGSASQLKFQYDTKSQPIDTAAIVTTTSPRFSLPSVESNMFILKSVMSDSTNSPDLKLYKLTFKLNNNVLVLTSKMLLN